MKLCELRYAVQISEDGLYRVARAVLHAEASDCGTALSCILYHNHNDYPLPSPLPFLQE
jgi:hypothetical protein